MNILNDNDLKLIEEELQKGKNVLISFQKSKGLVIVRQQETKKMFERRI